MAKNGSEATTWGRRLARLAWFLLLIVGAVRALCFLTYAGLVVPIWLETHVLEAKMVHLAWRVQHGVELYPSWENGPFVANFFGPIYFGLVGLLGRSLNSSLADLFFVGRAVTLVSLVLTVAIAAGIAGRRSGRAAGLLAGLLVVGAAPFYGFGVMVRPDVMACLVGLVGFLMATARSRSIAVAGAIVLILAILTKQTTALYSLAAVPAILLDGNWRRALAIGLGVGLGTVAIVAGVTALFEPRFATDLLAERLAPWDFTSYRYLLWRVSIIAPELPTGLLIGAVLWGFGPAEIRERRLAVLALVLFLGCAISAGKFGSDINYFLPWVPLAAVAFAETATRLCRAQGPRAWLGWPVVGLALTTISFSFLHSEIQASSAIGLAGKAQSAAGRTFQAKFREVLALGRDPSLRILTDCGHLDIQRGEATQFGDPWLFRLLADTGRVNLDEAVRAIDEERYDLIVTTKPLSDLSYTDYVFGMPMPMVEAARRHYVFDRQESSLFLHRPRFGRLEFENNR